jgi:hypothetical protein
VYGCWLWQGNVDAQGYAWLWVGRGRRAWAHRHVYEAETGVPLAPGIELDHLCRRRSCVRPAHAEKVTQAENKRRMHWKNRAQRERCPAGHGLYENGRRTPEGGVVCLVCSGLRA